MPLVTIIIPTYNRKELLEKAVLSVLVQKSNILFEYEIIIIDDGSTDGTEEHIRKYVEDPENHIIYRYQENGGVGKARNHGLTLIDQKSDYLIFLDSDDELKETVIYECLSQWEVLTQKCSYEKTLGLYFLCEDEQGEIIGERKILKGKNIRTLTYSDYLDGVINIEMGIMTKSSIFLTDPKLRFEEDITTEGVMWAKMWKFMEIHKQELLILDIVGRVYKTHHDGEIRITKTVSPERFRRNAIGNERILGIIEGDLISRNLSHYYADILMRIGINWILAGNKKLGIEYLKDSLSHEKSARVFLLLLLSQIHTGIITLLYKLYI